MTQTVQDEWSWSRINSFRQGVEENGDGCAYSWYTTYRKNDRGQGNYFADYGLLAHNLIEKFGKGELFEWDIEDEVEKGITNFQYRPPFPRMGQGYVAKLRDFFCLNTFDGKSFSDRFKKYKFIESETEMHINLGGHKIRGFIDLVAKHDDYGFVVVDFKSSKPYIGKKLDNNIMQLYLYSIGIKEKYGHYPEHLIYYYFKEPQKEYAYKFSLDELERTKEYVLETIEMTKKYTSEDQFKPRCLDVPDNDFFACHLCNHRFSCEFSKLI
jgi:hypothetical protein